MSTRELVGLYLLALMIANALVFGVGQVALLATSLALIPFDFAVRVRLQERWQGPRLWLRLFGLMVAGGLLTLAVLPEAGRVAAASVIAFLCSSALGAWVYQDLKPFSAEHARWWSLGAMAVADSFLFPWIAFQSVMWWLVGLQCVTKWIVSWGIIHSRVLGTQDS